MLLGRERECQALDRLLAEGREGRSGSIALIGEAGIGKTALLEWVETRAEGMCVLRARGIESESHVPFAGLFELLRPALGAIDRIPKPQADALGGALALRPARSQDRFAVGAATLSLLAAYAEDEPVAVLVDDVHWLDGSSADALLFAIRRLVADPIATVLSAREEERSLLDGSDIPLLRVEGLDDRAAAELLARQAGEPLGSEVAERINRVAAGNPLALLELASEHRRVAELPPEAPLPVGTRIARSFLGRYAALPEETRRILVLAAASERGDLVAIERAAESLGLDVLALAAAETGGLVRLGGGRVEFRHPLARAAVYGDAPAGERRSAHRALADALPDLDADRRAWHLDLGSVGPDATASAALEQAGVRARDRSAYTVAAAAFERAARLALEGERQVRLLYDAADANWLGGRAESAVELLDEARGRASDPELVLQIEHLRGHVAMHRGRVEDGHRILVAAAERGAERDPEQAVSMLAEAASASFHAGDAREMLRTAERARALLPADAGPRTRFVAGLAHGMALIFAGAGETGPASIREAVEAVDPEEILADPRQVAWTGMAPLWLREGDLGRRLLDHLVEVARERGAVGMLPALLNYAGTEDAAGDRWAAAEVAWDEGIRLARESGLRMGLAASLVRRAWLEARQGKEDACRANVAEARALAAEHGLGLIELWGLEVLGELELARGDPAAAVAPLEEIARRLEEHGIGDADMSPAPELVEAYLRLGRSDEAVAVAAAFEERAHAKGAPWALARAARSSGLVAPEERFADCFEEARRLHEQTPDLFETARTRLAYGSRLRRTRQRVRARDELRAALEIFERLGATPWAELARAELAATGERARRRDPSSRDELTPQELQIGLLLADGKTTREAAAALFLSPKTIEYHLRNVYRKLGIRSRDELTAAMARAD